VLDLPGHFGPIALAADAEQLVGVSINGRFFTIADVLRLNVASAREQADLHRARAAAALAIADSYDRAAEAAADQLARLEANDDDSGAVA
jgi:hypothetical protein